MRRVLVLLGLLGLSAADAQADRVHVDPCAMFTRTVYPRSGEANVPLNADVWILGGDFDVHKYVVVDATGKRLTSKHRSSSNRPPITQLELADLAANQTYEVIRDDGKLTTTFTTGSARDTIAPVEPRLTQYEFRDARLQIEATVAPDTVITLIGVVPDDSKQKDTWQRFPTDAFAAAMSTCSMLEPADGHYCVRLVSFDVAGNQSDANGKCSRGMGADVVSMPAHDGKAILYLFFGVLPGLFIVGTRRSYGLRRAARATTTPVESEAVLRIALAVRRRFGLLACAAASACIAPLMFEPVVVLLLPLAALVVTFGSIALESSIVLEHVAMGAETTTDGASYIFVAREGKVRGFLNVGSLVMSRLNATELPQAKTVNLRRR